MSLVNELRKKQELLRLDYDESLLNTQILPGQPTPEEKVEFDTMVRWHKNSHVAESEWLQAFMKIQWSLDVKEKMQTPCDDITRFLRWF